MVVRPQSERRRGRGRPRVLGVRTRGHGARRWRGVFSAGRAACDATRTYGYACGDVLKERCEGSARSVCVCERGSRPARGGARPRSARLRSAKAKTSGGRPPLLRVSAVRTAVGPGCALSFSLSLTNTLSNRRQRGIAHDTSGAARLPRAPNVTYYSLRQKREGVGKERGYGHAAPSCAHHEQASVCRVRTSIPGALCLQYHATSASEDPPLLKPPGGGGGRLTTPRRRPRWPWVPPGSWLGCR